jgi:hypothetical protein
VSEGHFASNLNPLDFIEGNFVAGLNPYQLDLVQTYVIATPVIKGPSFVTTHAPRSAGQPPNGRHS